MLRRIGIVRKYFYDNCLFFCALRLKKNRRKMVKHLAAASKGGMPQ